MYNSTLKAAIEAAIHTPAEPKINGSILQQKLLEIISAIDAGAVFKGVATPASSPSGESNCFYLASTEGTYTNFLDTNGNAIVLAEGEVALLASIYNNDVLRWTKNLVPGRGENSYLHIMYAATQPTQDRDMHDTFTSGDKWIGICADANDTAPDKYDAYQWAKFVGDNGAPGADGHNPNLGTYLLDTTTEPPYPIDAPATAQDGDYIVVIDESQQPPTQRQWLWDNSLNDGAGGWKSTTVDPVAQFQTGEYVAATKIVNIPEVGGNGDVASAELVKNIAELNESCYLVCKGGNNASSLMYNGLENGKTYQIRILTTAWNTQGTSYAKLGMSLNNATDDSEVTSIASVIPANPVKELYTVKVPETGSYYLLIKVRGALGEKFKYIIKQIEEELKPLSWDLVCGNGILNKFTNFMHKGKYINSVGTTSNNSSWFYMDFDLPNPLVENDVIVWNGIYANANMCIAFFDNNGDAVGIKSATGNSRTLTVTSDDLVGAIKISASFYLPSQTNASLSVNGIYLEPKLILPNEYTDVEIEQLLDNADNIPVEGSGNLITSGAVYSAINKSYEYSYIGNKVDLRRTFNATLFMNNAYYTGDSGQGCVSFDNYLLVGGAGGTIKIYNLLTKSNISDITLASAAPNNHVNNLCFGAEGDVNNSDFSKYLYVSACGDSSSNDNNCYVENLTLQGSTLLQTISYSGNDLYYVEYVVDYDHNLLYAIGQTEMYATSSNNKIKILKFALPLISDGANVQLSASDVIETFEYDGTINFMYIFQGAYYYNNMIYFSCGGYDSPSNTNYMPHKIFVINCFSGLVESVIDMRRIKRECESVTVYKNTLLACYPNQRMIYQLEF